MRVGSIKAADAIKGSLRIDPSYYLSEGIKIRSDLKRSPYGLVAVGECASKVFFGNIFSRIWVKDAEHGVPYLAASDTVLTDLDTGSFIARKQADLLQYLRLKKDWILITCSGTIGNVTYTHEGFEKYIATHDLIRIVPNDNKILRGVLYAFLNSKYGYVQLTQSKYGGVVKHISDKYVESIDIPLFPNSLQVEVNDLIQDVAKLRAQAAILKESAINLLSQHIQCKALKSGMKVKTVKAQESIKSLTLRLDPPALMNEGVDAMKEVVANYQCRTIKELGINVYRPGIFKRIYVEKGIPYITGSEIFKSNPFRSCQMLSNSRTPFIDEMKMREGQILITCAGSVGDVKMITKEYEDKDAIGSQDIIRLESKDELFTKEYLFVYLQLPFVYDYIQSMKYGSVIERIEPFHVESIPVIKPTKEVSEKITSLIQEYMDYSYRAFKSEEEAISLVEKEIESWSK